jgi:hypothetical protein
MRWVVKYLDALDDLVLGFFWRRSPWYAPSDKEIAEELRQKGLAYASMIPQPTIRISGPVKAKQPPTTVVLESNEEDWDYVSAFDAPTKLFEIDDTEAPISPEWQAALDEYVANRTDADEELDRHAIDSAKLRLKYGAGDHLHSALMALQALKQAI